MTATTAFIVLCGALLVNGAFIKRPHLDGRIIGGVDAQIEDYPYQLSLVSDGYSLCGATIISENWVLTSGHCVYAASTGSMVLRAGSSKLNSGGLLCAVSRKIVHEQFVRDTNDYDFALLQVETPFCFGPGIQPIGLVNTEPATGEDSVISGWGQTSPSGRYSEQLQVAHVPIFDRDQCKEVYETYQPVTERMFCAGGLDEGGVDSGIGDNGGPLVVGGKLAGISGWGAAPGKPGFPTVYSNIANQRAWIKEKSGI